MVHTPSGYQVSKLVQCCFDHSNWCRTVWLSISFASLFPFVPATFWAGCCASCVNALCLGVSTRCSKIKELFLSFRYIILPFQPWMFNCVRQSQWFQSIKTGCLSSSRRLSGSGFFWTAHVDRCTFVCSGPDPKLRKKQARCSNLAWSFNTLWKTCTSVRSIVMRDALVVSSLCAQTLFDAWPFSPFASELKMANWALPFRVRTMENNSRRAQLHQPALQWQAICCVGSGALRGFETPCFLAWLDRMRDDWGVRESMDVLLNLLKRYIFPSECLQMTLKRVIQIRCLVWRSLSTTTKPKLYLNHVGFAGAVEAPTGDGWIQVIGVQVAVRHPLWNWVTSHYPQDKPQVGNGYTFQIPDQAGEP